VASRCRRAELTPKRAAGIIAKVIKSAAANAEDKSGGDASVEDLRIHTIAVDGGTINKRFMPRSMGRANRINHRTSHLTVVVTDEAK
jgi:large subunit ribosomal protein L22